HDPFLMKDMDKAVARIHSAALNHEKVCIYGDYDVDGVTATTALFTYLVSIGIVCECFIPDRISEGYGLNKHSIFEIAKQNNLIITVDTGITAIEETEFAKQLGIDLIITDHHSCREIIPDAVAVINPHRQDCLYPFKFLAGVGVVFKLICALEGDSSKIFEEYADIVAIGTVADVMPIIDENRLIVDKGLKMLEKTSRNGLYALMCNAGVFKDGIRKQIFSSTIGFAIAPRINAAGRISSANKALELFLSPDAYSADILAKELCEINKRRQFTEQGIYEDALKQIACYQKNTYSYVLSSNSWHQGVVGVVANKISEKYTSPVILFSFDGDIGKGSGRSIKGLSLMEALSSCSELLIEYGGHDLAAGLSIERKNLRAFAEKFEDYTKQQFDGKIISIPVEIDCEMLFDEINMKNARELEKLEPFGLMNPTPIFLLKNITIVDISPISDDKHIRIRIKDRSSIKEITCIYFGMSHSEFPFSRGDSCEFACSLGINDYNGNKTVQVIVRDVRPCEIERETIRESRRIYQRMSEKKRDEQIPQELIPSLENFRAVFRTLKHELGNERHRVSYRYLKCKIEQCENHVINLCTLKIVVDVLSEFGLADCIKVRGNDIVEIQLLPYSQKIDLEKSEILKEIKNRSKKSL
ncbi:MAG: single-stranded-DNA-specific exonuclease RecJ, partial [Clostridia bacterium]